MPKADPYHGTGIDVCPVSGKPVPKPRYFWTQADRPGMLNACGACSDFQPATLAEINSRRAKERSRRRFIGPVPAGRRGNIKLAGKPAKEE